MAVRATAKRKRGSAPVSPPSDGRTARRARGSGGGASAAAAAEQEEPPTLMAVDSGESEWATALRAPREAGLFIDIALLAGGRRIEAHRNVLVGFSPYLLGLLTSGLAESTAQSRELTLEDMDGRAAEAVVDCMYSGKLALSSRTVTAVIRAANLLQVGAVEKAAGEFFVSKLELSTAADALGFAAERVECGEHAKKLHEQCVEYAIEHFAALSCESSFLSLPVGTVASLIASDKLPVKEAGVVSAVRSWFEHDADERKESLKTLMPLIRWPLLPVEARKALPVEPLLMQLMALDDESRQLGITLMLECGSTHSRDSVLASGCPRLKRRAGAALPLPILTFSAFSSNHYRLSEEGALIEAIASVPRCSATAMCGGHVMNSGESCAEVTVVRKTGALVLGVGRPTLGTELENPDATHQFWGVQSYDGGMTHYRQECGLGSNWNGAQGFDEGDVMRLLLDLDAGTLTIKKNGALLGVAVTSGLSGDLCWAIRCLREGDSLRIKAVDPEDF
jgi:hypothetical protein